MATKTLDRSDSADLWHRVGDQFQRWQGGEEEALADLVQTMTPVLWHVVRAYRLSASQAEDVIAVTWFQLIHAHAQIRDPRCVGGWLTTTARREAWRTVRTDGRTAVLDREALDLVLPRQRSAEADVQYAADCDRLWQAVDGLPDRCRRLLRIVAFERRPHYAQLAVDLGIPVGSIGPTRSRCLAKLRVALLAQGADA